MPSTLKQKHPPLCERSLTIGVSSFQSSQVPEEPRAHRPANAPDDRPQDDGVPACHLTHRHLSKAAGELSLPAPAHLCPLPHWHSLSLPCSPRLRPSFHAIWVPHLTFPLLLASCPYEEPRAQHEEPPTRGGHRGTAPLPRRPSDEGMPGTGQRAWSPTTHKVRSADHIQGLSWEPTEHVEPRIPLRATGPEPTCATSSLAHLDVHTGVWEAPV